MTVFILRCLDVLQVEHVVHSLPQFVENLIEIANKGAQNFPTRALFFTFPLFLPRPVQVT